MDFNRKVNLIIILTLILLNFIIYFNSIGNEFVWDDSFNVVENDFIKDTGNIKKLITMEDVSPYSKSSGYLRPFVNLTYLIDYQIYKDKAYGYRITNIVFHILCSIVLFYLTLLITESKLLSIIASLIFSAQAVHVEAVAFISARNNILCALFILLSVYFYVKNRKSTKTLHLIYSLIFLFLGAASKEFAFVAPLIFILYDYSFGAGFSLKKNLGKYIAAFSTVLLFLIYKSLVMPKGNAFPFDLPTLYIRIINTFPIMIKYITSQILPYNLSLRFDMHTKNSFLEPVVLVSFLLFVAAVFLVFWYREKNKLLFFSFFSYLILLIPVSNIVKIPAALMADRWLYPASAFFSIFLSRIITSIFNKKEVLAPIVTVAFVVLLSFFTVQRNRVFKNNFNLFYDAVNKNPKESMARANLAMEYEKRGDLKEAERQYLQALKYNPGYNAFIIYNNLGVLYASSNDHKTALYFYKKAFSINKNNPPLATNIGKRHSYLGDLDKGNEFYKIAINLAPDYFPAYFNLAKNYHQQKMYNESLDVLQKVLNLSHKQSDKQKAMEFMNRINNEIKNYPSK